MALRTAFIGQRNHFDLFVCDWLDANSDLEVVLWTNRLAWAAGGPDRTKRVVKRFTKRAKTKGVGRALNEAAYYGLYRALVMSKDGPLVHDAVEAARVHHGLPAGTPTYDEVMVDDITSPELLEDLRSRDLDAIFAMCIDVYLPDDLLDTARLGGFLWHEGITPEYKGVYSPFWALYNQDYENLGYTVLRMNDRLDDGEIYLQGRADIDPNRHWHSYIGHKAVLDSLPEVAVLLEQLENDTAVTTSRDGATSGFYSYPTATGLVRIAAKRMLDRRSAATAAAN